VHPDFQLRGFGRQMLEGAIAVARSLPADAIFLDSYDAQAGAGEFYARCGYREVGRVVYRETPLIYFEMLLK
jgi:GNAT superfamily N-acetyltransferase